MNYYKSDYGEDIYDLTQLAKLEEDAAAEEIGEVEDGVVLLKNDNNALPWPQAAVCLYSVRTR